MLLFISILMSPKGSRNCREAPLNLKFLLNLAIVWFHYFQVLWILRTHIQQHIHNISTYIPCTLGNQLLSLPWIWTGLHFCIFFILFLVVWNIFPPLPILPEFSLLPSFKLSFKFSNTKYSQAYKGKCEKCHCLGISCN